MKTAFAISPILRPAIVTAYSEDRAAQIERACNGALNDVSKDKGPDGKPYVGTVQVRAGDIRWNGQINGGMSYNAKGKLGAKEAQWKETEQTVYTVEQSTAPIEFVKFHGALVMLYRRAGSLPSGQLTIDVVPKYCREWFDAMHAKSVGGASAVKTINRRIRKDKAAKDQATETTGTPATDATATNGAPVNA